MTPLKRFPPDDPREWLNRARSNLARAREAPKIAGVYLEDVCFDAQQAAEKAIKAILVLRRVAFPWVHDLGELLDLVAESGVEVPEEVRRCEDLTQYATGGRYPGSDEPVSDEECAAAIERAATVVAWAEKLVGEESVP
jgi:HEPN domain-containing protein